MIGFLDGTLAELVLEHLDDVGDSVLEYQVRPVSFLDVLYCSLAELLDGERDCSLPLPCRAHRAHALIPNRTMVYTSQATGQATRVKRCGIQGLKVGADPVARLVSLEGLHATATDGVNRLVTPASKAACILIQSWRNVSVYEACVAHHVVLWAIHLLVLDRGEPAAIGPEKQLFGLQVLIAKVEFIDLHQGTLCVQLHLGDYLAVLLMVDGCCVMVVCPRHPHDITNAAKTD